jgi:hypothetical protein
MPRDGAIIFSDLIGGLELRRIECSKCGRSGRYRLADLISRYGRDEKLFAFTEDVIANCARKHTRSDNDPSRSAPICRNPCNALRAISGLLIRAVSEIAKRGPRSRRALLSLPRYGSGRG